MLSVVGPLYAPKVLNIPLGDVPTADSHYWKLAKDGVYTVRTAYWFGFLSKTGHQTLLSMGYPRTYGHGSGHWIRCQR